MLSDNPAGQHAGIEERIDIADGEHSVVMVRTEDSYLLLPQQRTDAGRRQDVVNFADVYPLAHTFSSTSVTGMRS